MCKMMLHRRWHHPRQRMADNQSNHMKSSASRQHFHSSLYSVSHQNRLSSCPMWCQSTFSKWTDASPDRSAAFRCMSICVISNFTQQVITKKLKECHFVFPYIQATKLNSRMLHCKLAVANSTNPANLSHHLYRHYHGRRQHQFVCHHHLWSGMG